MIEAWGRIFEKIREACTLYDGTLPEYEINEAGIMVLCKACDKYLELLRIDGQHPNYYPNQDGQDMNKLIVDFCKEPRSVQEIMDKFATFYSVDKVIDYFKKKYPVFWKKLDNKIFFTEEINNKIVFGYKDMFNIVGQIFDKYISTGKYDISNIIGAEEQGKEQSPEKKNTID